MIVVASIVTGELGGQMGTVLGRNDAISRGHQASCTACSVNQEKFEWPETSSLKAMHVSALRYSDQPQSTHQFAK